MRLLSYGGMDKAREILFQVLFTKGIYSMQNLIRFFLCMIVGCMVTLSSKADVLSDHYRTLDIKATYTNQSKDFTVKHLFPFHLPENLPGKPVFKGLSGTYTIHAEPTYNAQGQEVTYAETLFGIAYSSNSCPQPGEAVNGYADYDNKYDPHSLAGQILKQTEGGKDQSSMVNYINPYDIKLNINKNGCLFTLFDGTDFQGKNYTIQVDLKLLYSFEPLAVGLDAEMIVDFSNKTNPTLNAYVVVPVTNADKVTGVVMKPGTLINVAGNIASSSIYAPNKGHWFIRYITAIYQKQSCQEAFPKHQKGKFTWNDHTGTSSKRNESSLFWPTTKIISDFTVMGKDRESVTTQMEAHDMPVHVEEGDCLVQAAIPYGDSTTVNGTNDNIEFQVFANYIPD